MAPDEPLARGWERQLDRAEEPALLRRSTHRARLSPLAACARIEYVRAPRRATRPAPALAEARIIAHHPPYLERVWHDETGRVASRRRAAAGHRRRPRVDATRLAHGRRHAARRGAGPRALHAALDPRRRRCVRPARRWTVFASVGPVRCNCDRRCSGIAACARDRRELLPAVLGAPVFLAAVRALGACRSTLSVQFSTFEGDSSGEQIAALLMEQAAAGVLVRLVLDHYTIRRRRRAARASPAAPTSACERHALARSSPWSPAASISAHRTLGSMARYMLFRDHKKLIVIDGRVAYVGGINVSDHNFAWNDFMVRVEGPVVHDLVGDFVSTWQGRRLRLIGPPVPGDYVVNQTAGRPAVLGDAPPRRCARDTIFLERRHSSGTGSSGHCSTRPTRRVRHRRRAGAAQPVDLPCVVAQDDARDPASQHHRARLPRLWCDTHASC